MMKKHHFLLLAVLPLLFTGCIPETQPAYYLSPLDVNSHHYHSIPLRADSLQHATYASVAIAGGSSNARWKENLYAFQAAIHRSYTHGMLEGYYGAGIMGGSYHIVDYDRVKYVDSTYPYSSDTLFHAAGQKQFFGAVGVNGGLNLALPTRKFGEFRIGVESSIYREFGRYLDFRKSLTDSAADIYAVSPWNVTFGGFVEIIAKRHWNGSEFGYRFSAGGTFISPGSYKGDSRINGPFYIINTLHVTRGRVTGFGQINIGVHTGTFQTGVNYRIGIHH